MTHIDKRRDTAANWTSVNPILELGEEGYETDTRLSKTGDGVTAWSTLAYDKAVVTKAEVGLDQVDNTSDLDKPISTATQTALDAKANLASPALTGNPTAPTPLLGDNDTSIATTEFVQALIANSPALGGFPTAPTPSIADNDTSVATTAFVQALLAAFAVVGSGTFTIGPVKIQWGNGTIDASAAAAGAIINSTFTYPTAFSGAPYFIGAGISGFVSGSSGAAYRGVDVRTTTSARFNVVNTSDAAATFTALPYSWFAMGPA